MLKEGIGLLALILGMMGGDSENLVFPVCLALVGVWMIFTSNDNN